VRHVSLVYIFPRTYSSKDKLDYYLVGTRLFVDTVRFECDTISIFGCVSSSCIFMRIKFVQQRMEILMYVCIECRHSYVYIFILMRTVVDVVMRNGNY